MSHCTKFDFSFTNERAIVKTFHKLNMKCSTGMVSEFNSDLSKHVLGALGHVGNRQFRSIIGLAGKYQLFVCKVADDQYELFIERNDIGVNDDAEMEQIAQQFKMAYIEVAVDSIIKKLDNSNMPSQVKRLDNGFIINFGPTMQYTISIIQDNNLIAENVEGIKGDLCTRLTEDIEDILSHPTAELHTEFKTEYNMMVDDQNIQILNLSF